MVTPTAYSTATWETYVNKQKTVQAALVAGKNLKIFTQTITFGDTVTYATNGIAVTLGDATISDAIIAAIPVSTNVGFVFSYDVANKKLIAYGQDGTTGALAELANASPALQSKVVTLLIIGV